MNEQRRDRLQRLFLGIEIPEFIKQQLNITLKAKITGAKWVKDNQHHITLLFVGDVTPNKYDNVTELADSVKELPFHLQLKGLNFFGTGRSPRVLYVGIEENKTLYNLQNQLVRKAPDFDFIVEKRKFTPHLTLARMKNPSSEHLGQFLEENALTKFDPFEVNHISLFESQLTHEGATYSVRENFYLG